MIYILSFMVLGVFWLMHHAVFDRIKYYDGTQAWLNIVFLMFVALIPFSTALFGEYGAERTTALFYGGNLVLLFVMLESLFTYSTSSQAKLLDNELEPDIVRGGRIMGIIYIVLVLLAMAISFASPVAAFIIYGILVGTIILLVVLGRGERAYIWSPKKTVVQPK